MSGQVRGFTLVEILVVLVIAGIAASLLGLAVGSSEGALVEREMRRLEVALASTAERAQIAGLPLAMEFPAEGYRVVAAAGPGLWRPLAGDPLLREIRLPPGCAWLSLDIGGRAQTPPWRLIFSTLPPRFRLRLSTPLGPRVFEGNSLGGVSLQGAATGS